MSGPSAEDVEVAAHALCAAIPVNTATTWDHVREHYREWCRDQARAVLASDWLTAHTAAAEARGAERGARAVVEAVEGGCRLVSPDHLTPMGKRQIMAAAREAAARVEGGA